MTQVGIDSSAQQFDLGGGEHLPNADGAIALKLGYLFLGQPPPEAPGPPPAACGPDNDAVHLGCAETCPG